VRKRLRPNGRDNIPIPTDAETASRVIHTGTLLRSTAVLKTRLRWVGWVAPLVGWVFIKLCDYWPWASFTV
jgi:hypothetical protein